MDEQQLQTIFDRLVKELESLNMRWVVDQVSATIEMGKVTTREVPTLKAEGVQTLFDVGDHELMYRSASKAVYPVATPYTSAERLQLLIRAFRRAIVDTIEMQGFIVHFLVEDTDRPVEVSLVAETQAHTLVLDSARTESLMQSASQLDHMLHALELRIAEQK